ncbi:MAG: tetratricopeptide repeat protein [Candidatus Omnitrophota bacterium]|nr:tetratricopeptide repeat protein [Candidatus Omnitrophota bacterium]
MLGLLSWHENRIETLRRISKEPGLLSLAAGLERCGADRKDVMKTLCGLSRAGNPRKAAREFRLLAAELEQYGVGGEDIGEILCGLSRAGNPRKAAREFRLLAAELEQCGVGEEDIGETLRGLFEYGNLKEAAEEFRLLAAKLKRHGVSGCYFGKMLGFLSWHENRIETARRISKEPEFLSLAAGLERCGADRKDVITMLKVLAWDKNGIETARRISKEPEFLSLAVELKQSEGAKEQFIVIIEILLCDLSRDNNLKEAAKKSRLLTAELKRYGVSNAHLLKTLRAFLIDGIIRGRKGWTLIEFLGRLIKIEAVAESNIESALRGIIEATKKEAMSGFTDKKTARVLMGVNFLSLGLLVRSLSYNADCGCPKEKVDVFQKAEELWDEGVIDLLASLAEPLSSFEKMILPEIFFLTIKSNMDAQGIKTYLEAMVRTMRGEILSKDVFDLLAPVHFGRNTLRLIPGEQRFLVTKTVGSELDRNREYEGFVDLSKISGFIRNVERVGKYSVRYTAPYSIIIIPTDKLPFLNKGEIVLIDNDLMFNIFYEIFSLASQNKFHSAITLLMHSGCRPWIFMPSCFNYLSIEEQNNISLKPGDYHFTREYYKFKDGGFHVVDFKDERLEVFPFDSSNRQIDGINISMRHINARVGMALCDGGEIIEGHPSLIISSFFEVVFFLIYGGIQDNLSNEDIIGIFENILMNGELFFSKHEPLLGLIDTMRKGNSLFAIDYRGMIRFLEERIFLSYEDYRLPAKIVLKRQDTGEEKQIDMTGSAFFQDPAPKIIHSEKKIIKSATHIILPWEDSTKRYIKVYEQIDRKLKVSSNLLSKSSSSPAELSRFLFESSYGLRNIAHSLQLKTKGPSAASPAERKIAGDKNFEWQEFILPGGEIVKKKVPEIYPFLKKNLQEAKREIAQWIRATDWRIWHVRQGNTPHPALVREKLLLLENAIKSTYLIGGLVRKIFNGSCTFDVDIYFPDNPDNYDGLIHVISTKLFNSVNRPGDVLTPTTDIFAQPCFSIDRVLINLSGNKVSELKKGAIDDLHDKCLRIVNKDRLACITKGDFEYLLRRAKRYIAEGYRAEEKEVQERFFLGEQFYREANKQVTERCYKTVSLLAEGGNNLASGFAGIIEKGKKNSSSPVKENGHISTVLLLEMAVKGELTKQIYEALKPAPIRGENLGNSFYSVSEVAELADVNRVMVLLYITSRLLKAERRKDGWVIPGEEAGKVINCKPLSEAAKISGITDKALRKLADEGKIESLDFGTGTRRFLKTPVKEISRLADISWFICRLKEIGWEYPRLKDPDKIGELIKEAKALKLDSGQLEILGELEIKDIKGYGRSRRLRLDLLKKLVEYREYWSDSLYTADYPHDDSSGAASPIEKMNNLAGQKQKESNKPGIIDAYDIGHEPGIIFLEERFFGYGTVKIDRELTKDKFMKYVNSGYIRIGVWANGAGEVYFEETEVVNIYKDYEKRADVWDKERLYKGGKGNAFRIKVPIRPGIMGEFEFSLYFHTKEEKPADFYWTTDYENNAALQVVKLQDLEMKAGRTIFNNYMEYLKLEGPGGFQSLLFLVYYSQTGKLTEAKKLTRIRRLARNALIRIARSKDVSVRRQLAGDLRNVGGPEIAHLQLLLKKLLSDEDAIVRKKAGVTQFSFARRQAFAGMDHELINPVVMLTALAQRIKKGNIKPLDNYLDIIIHSAASIEKIVRYVNTKGSIDRLPAADLKDVLLNARKDITDLTGKIESVLSGLEKQLKGLSEESSGYFRYIFLMKEQYRNMNQAMETTIDRVIQYIFEFEDLIDVDKDISSPELKETVNETIAPLEKRRQEYEKKAENEDGLGEKTTKPHRTSSPIEKTGQSSELTAQSSKLNKVFTPGIYFRERLPLRGWTGDSRAPGAVYSTTLLLWLALSTHSPPVSVKSRILEVRNRKSAIGSQKSDVRRQILPLFILYPLSFCKAHGSYPYTLTGTSGHKQLMAHTLTGISSPQPGPLSFYKTHSPFAVSPITGSSSPLRTRREFIITAIAAGSLFELDRLSVLQKTAFLFFRFLKCILKPIAAEAVELKKDSFDGLSPNLEQKLLELDYPEKALPVLLGRFKQAFANNNKIYSVLAHLKEKSQGSKAYLKALFDLNQLVRKISCDESGGPAPLLRSLVVSLDSKGVLKRPAGHLGNERIPLNIRKKLQKLPGIAFRDSARSQLGHILLSLAGVRVKSAEMTDIIDGMGHTFNVIPHYSDEAVFFFFDPNLGIVTKVNLNNCYPGKEGAYRILGKNYRIAQKDLSLLQRKLRKRAVDIRQLSQKERLSLLYFRIRIIDDDKQFKENYKHAFTPSMYNDIGFVDIALDKIIRNPRHCKEAIEYFRKAVARDPSYASAYHNIGFACIKLGIVTREAGYFKEAIEYFRKAVARDPSYASAYHNIGFAYVNLGGITGKYSYYKDAIGPFERVITLRPSHAPAYNNLGSIKTKLAGIYSNAGYCREAIGHFKKAIAIDPSYAPAGKNLQEAEELLGRILNGDSKYYRMPEDPIRLRYETTNRQGAKGTVAASASPLSKILLLSLVMLILPGCSLAGFVSENIELVFITGGILVIVLAVYAIYILAKQFKEFDETVTRALVLIEENGLTDPGESGSKKTNKKTKPPGERPDYLKVVDSKKKPKSSSPVTKECQSVKVSESQKGGAAAASPAIGEDRSPLPIVHSHRPKGFASSSPVALSTEKLVSYISGRLYILPAHKLFSLLSDNELRIVYTAIVTFTNELGAYTLSVSRTLTTLLTDTNFLKAIENGFVDLADYLSLWMIHKMMQDTVGSPIISPALSKLSSSPVSRLTGFVASPARGTASPGPVEKNPRIHDNHHSRNRKPALAVFVERARAYTDSLSEIYALGKQVNLGFGNIDLVFEILGTSRVITKHDRFLMAHPRIYQWIQDVQEEFSDIQPFMMPCNRLHFSRDVLFTSKNNYASSPLDKERSAYFDRVIQILSKFIAANREKTFILVIDGYTGIGKTPFSKQLRTALVKESGIGKKAVLIVEADRLNKLYALDITRRHSYHPELRSTIKRAFACKKRVVIYEGLGTEKVFRKIQRDFANKEVFLITITNQIEITYLSSSSPIDDIDESSSPLSSKEKEILNIFERIIQLGKRAVLNREIETAQVAFNAAVDNCEKLLQGLERVEPAEFYIEIKKLAGSLQADISGVEKLYWARPQHSTTAASPVEFLKIDKMEDGRKIEAYLLVIRLKRYYAGLFIKTYYETVEEVLLPDKVEICAKVRGKTDSGGEGNIPKFNSDSVQVNRDKAAVANHNIGNFTFGIIYSQVRSDSSQKNGDVCSAIDVRFGFQRSLWSFHLDFDNWIKLSFVNFIGEFYLLFSRIFYKRWENSSEPGIGIDKGTESGYLSLAFLTASSPVNISPRQITIRRWGYFLTKRSKFLLTKVSLSKSFFIPSSGCWFPSIAVLCEKVKVKNRIAKNNRVRSRHLTHRREETGSPVKNQSIKKKFTGAGISSEKPRKVIRFVSRKGQLAALIKRMEGLSSFYLLPAELEVQGTWRDLIGLFKNPELFPFSNSFGIYEERCHIKDKVDKLKIRNTRSVHTGASSPVFRKKFRAIATYAIPGILMLFITVNYMANLVAIIKELGLWKVAKEALSERSLWEWIGIVIFVIVADHFLTRKRILKVYGTVKYKTIIKEAQGIMKEEYRRVLDNFNGAATKEKSAAVKKMMKLTKVDFFWERYPAGIDDDWAEEIVRNKAKTVLQPLSAELYWGDRSRFREQAVYAGALLAYKLGYLEYSSFTPSIVVLSGSLPEILSKHNAQRITRDAKRAGYEINSSSPVDEQLARHNFPLLRYGRCLRRLIVENVKKHTALILPTRRYNKAFKKVLRDKIKPSQIELLNQYNWDTKKELLVYDAIWEAEKKVLLAKKGLKEIQENTNKAGSPRGTAFAASPVKDSLIIDIPMGKFPHSGILVNNIDRLIKCLSEIYKRDLTVNKYFCWRNILFDWFKRGIVTLNEITYLPAERRLLKNGKDIFLSFSRLGAHLQYTYTNQEFYDFLEWVDKKLKVAFHKTQIEFPELRKIEITGSFGEGKPAICSDIDIILAVKNQYTADKIKPRFRKNFSLNRNIYPWFKVDVLIWSEYYPCLLSYDGKSYFDSREERFDSLMQFIAAPPLTSKGSSPLKDKGPKRRHKVPKTSMIEALDKSGGNAQKASKKLRINISTLFRNLSPEEIDLRRERAKIILGEKERVRFIKILEGVCFKKKWDKQAVKLLNVSLSTFYRRYKEYGISIKDIRKEQAVRTLTELQGNCSQAARHLGIGKKSALFGDEKEKSSIRREAEGRERKRRIRELFLALVKTRGNKASAAKKLGFSPGAVYHWMKTYSYYEVKKEALAVINESLCALAIQGLRVSRLFAKTGDNDGLLESYFSKKHLQIERCSRQIRQREETDIHQRLDLFDPFVKLQSDIKRLNAELRIAGHYLKVYQRGQRVTNAETIRFFEELFHNRSELKERVLQDLFYWYFRAGEVLTEDFLRINSLYVQKYSFFIYRYLFNEDYPGLLRQKKPYNHYKRIYTISLTQPPGGKI